MTTKNQHYVPQFYLKGFSINSLNTNSFVYVYDKKFAKGIPPKQLKSVSSICKEIFYYKQTREGDDDVEKRLSNIESQIAPIIKHIKDNINKGIALSEKKKVLLAFMIGLSVTRVPSFRNPVRKAFQWGLERVIDDIKRNPKNKEEELIKEMPEGSFIAQDQCSLRSMAEMAGFIAKTAFKKPFEFLLPCGTIFITSDNPVLHFGDQNMGVGHPLSCVFFPLRKDIGLLCNPRGKDMNIRQLAKKEVKEINKEIVYKADRYVICDRQSEVLARLVKEYKNNGGHRGVISSDDKGIMWAPH